jgi:DNA-binding transcriptional ArsR family regulator
MNSEILELKKRFVTNAAVCEQIIDLFHLLSNKIRFRTVCLLCRGRFCVNEIVDIINCGNLTNISQHLKLLTLASVIKRTRDKRRIIYTVEDPSIKALVNYLEQHYAHMRK